MHCLINYNWRRFTIISSFFFSSLSSSPAYCCTNKSRFVEAFHSALQHCDVSVTANATLTMDINSMYCGLCTYVPTATYSLLYLFQLKNFFLNCKMHGMNETEERTTSVHLFHLIMIIIHQEDRVGARVVTAAINLYNMIIQG